MKFARLLTWTGPAHYPVPHNGIAARTYNEIDVEHTLPMDKKAYWREGDALFTKDEMQAALAAERERCREVACRLACTDENAEEISYAISALGDES
jgi:hypothetical protein